MIGHLVSIVRFIPPTQFAADNAKQIQMATVMTCLINTEETERRAWKKATERDCYTHTVATDVKNFKD
jgi:hypothetical protein